MIKLSKRLQKIYDFIDDGSVVKDIGADHGKLIISLIENHKVSKDYANENKKGPYKRLELATKDYPNINISFSDGLEKLAKDVNTLVLAGMGGHLIAKILLDNAKKLDQIEYIIIDAHNDNSFIRKTIANLNYKIIDEDIVLENKVYYEIIKFQKTDKTKIYNDIELKYGPILVKNKPVLFIQKYQKRLEVIDKLLAIKSLSSYRKTNLKKERENLNNILK